MARAKKAKFGLFEKYIPIYIILAGLKEPLLSCLDTLKLE
jgi:hypothetical protein